jgi:spore maturation protein CgeB
MEEFSKYRILSVGNFCLFGASNTCLHRAEAMRSLGAHVGCIDTGSQWTSYRVRTARRLYGLGVPIPLPDVTRANRNVVAAVTNETWDLLWLDKDLVLSPATFTIIKKLRPRCIIAGYSPDDMLNRHNQSMQFLRSLPYYDIFFTPKSFNVSELAELGCKKVVFIDKGYQDTFHFPRLLEASDVERLGGEVGFIGSYEYERAMMLRYLADNGVPVRIFGEGWHKFKPATNCRVEKKALYGEDYPKAISAFKIILCFLRKINRDLQTTRSIEIPACRGFMLAERTIEHMRLFQEGKEAEFFESREELLQKCRYYLEHEEQRQKIAEAGYKRCIDSGYSNKERMKSMLKQVFKFGATSSNE